MTAVRRPRVLLGVALAACAARGFAQAPMVQPDLGCTPGMGIVPVCKFDRPEDLEVLPGGQAVIVSEYGSLDGRRAGRLSLYRPDDDSVLRLYPPRAGEAAAASDGPAWGEAKCPGAPGAAFSPHGIHLATIDGVLRLLVVNHGGRESIEMFEVQASADGRDASLVWRGCVTTPTNAWLNDVANLPDGGLVTGHMTKRGTDEETLLKLEKTKANSGFVWAWHAGEGWDHERGTEGALPNGLQVSPDGKVLYVNYYYGDTVVAIERGTGKHLWETDLSAPDNLSWARDGLLLDVSHRFGQKDVVECARAETPTCTLPFAVVAIDAQTGVKTPVMEGGPPPMGAVTVAVPMGTRLLLGSFVGNRLGRIENIALP